MRGAPVTSRGESVFDDRNFDRRLEQEARGQQLDPERHLLVAPDACVGVEADVAVLIVSQLLQRRSHIQPARHERRWWRRVGPSPRRCWIEPVPRGDLRLRPRAGRGGAGHAATRRSRQRAASTAAAPRWRKRRSVSDRERRAWVRVTLVLQYRLPDSSEDRFTSCIVRSRNRWLREADAPRAPLFRMDAVSLDYARSEGPGSG